MYGNEVLDNHQILKYSFEKEFYLTFRFLKYRGIELSPIILRPYDSYIQTYINRFISDKNYISIIKKRYGIETIKDVQLSMNLLPKNTKDFSVNHSNKVMIMPASLVNFALDKLNNYQIILIATNKRDHLSLENLQIPNNFRVLDINEEMNQVLISKEPLTKNIIIIENILKEKSKHKIFGSRKFKSWLNIHVERTIKIITILDNLIKQYGPSIIIDITEYAQVPITLTLLSRKYNIPFITVPQDLITDISLIPSRASHYFVWGKNYRDWLVKRGIDKSAIKVTGNLRFEYLDSVSSISRNQLIKLHGISPNNYILTFTTQSFPKEVNEEIMMWIKYTFIESNQANNLPVSLIIKPHPSDLLNYNNYLENGRIVLVDSSLKLYDLLNNTDFVMTISSTTGIEAAILKKGLIILQPQIPYLNARNTNDFNSHLVNATAGAVVYNQGQLKHCVERIVNEEDYRNELIIQSQKFLNNTLYLSEKATPSEITKKYIEKILSQR